MKSQVACSVALVPAATVLIRASSSASLVTHGRIEDCQAAFADKFVVFQLVQVGHQVNIDIDIAGAVNTDFAGWHTLALQGAFPQAGLWLCCGRPAPV